MPPVRRLTAILAADVAGYSRLMGADEEGTHDRGPHLWQPALRCYVDPTKRSDRSARCAQTERPEETRMTDFRAARPWCSRRDFLKSSAAVAAGVYGMGWALADAADPPLEFDGSKFLLKAAEPNP